jgi:hypothetical protein
MPNKRVIYATKGLAIKKTGATPGSGVLAQTASGLNPTNLWEVPRGIQSVNVTTTYNLDQIFQQGQLAIYENVEDRPTVEMTINRVLDGTMPLYMIASDESLGSSLTARTSNYKADIALHIYPDTNTRASGLPDSRMLASGMFMSSINYTLPVDGPSTEEIAFSSNDKFWAVADGGSAPNSIFPSGGTQSIIPGDEDASAVGPTVLGRGVTRREDFDLSGSTLPADIPTLDRSAFQNITVSVDLNRDEIFALGSKGAYTQTIQFPIEVTCSFECVTSEGDLKQAISAQDNLTNRTIVIKTKQGLSLNLGTKNKLSSIEFSGGDTSGGNVTVTYNFSTFNDLIITATGYAH